MFWAGFRPRCWVTVGPVVVDVASRNTSNWRWRRAFQGWDPTKWWHRASARDLLAWWFRHPAEVAVHHCQVEWNRTWIQPRGPPSCLCSAWVYSPPSSVMHISGRWTAIVMSRRWHWRCNWVSSAYEWRLTPYVLAASARSAVYKINRRGPSTEPCGTEHTRLTTDDVPLAYTTWNVLSVQYRKRQSHRLITAVNQWAVSLLWRN